MAKRTIKLPPQYETVPASEIANELLIMDFERLVDGIITEGIKKTIHDVPCLLVALPVTTVARYKMALNKVKK